MCYFNQPKRNYTITLYNKTIYLCILHCYMFRQFRVIVRQFTTNTLLSHPHSSICSCWKYTKTFINPLTPNDAYCDRTAPLTSKSCILYIYSTNTGTEYFKHGIYFPFISLQNAVCFIILTYMLPLLFTFYIQNVLKFKN